jgi:hypothetical protein
LLARPADQPGGGPRDPHDHGLRFSWCLAGQEGGPRGEGRGRRGRVEDRVLAEDRLLHPAERAAGVEAQVVEQSPAALGVGIERFRLAPGAVQDQHQQGPAPLAIGLLSRQLAGSCDELRRPAAIELDHQQFFPQALDQLLEPRGDNPGFGQVLEIGQGPSAAEGEGRPQGRLGGRPIAPAERLPAVRGQALQGLDVGRRPEDVAIVGGLDRQAQPAQAEDMRRDRVPGGEWRLVAPHGCLELRRVDRPAAVHRQPGQDPALEGPAGSDLSRAVPDEQRTENADLHRETLAERPGPPGPYQSGCSSGPRQRENSSVA